MYGKKVIVRYDPPHSNPEWGGHHPHSTLKRWQVCNPLAKINQSTKVLRANGISYVSQSSSEFDLLDIDD